MMEPIVNKKKLPRFKESSSNGTSAPAIRLLTHFRSLKDFEVVDKNGYSSVIVYAEKTVNDPKNPNGYAIAIAHTNCYELRLAYQNLKGIGDEKVRAVRT